MDCNSLLDILHQKNIELEATIIDQDIYIESLKKENKELKNKFISVVKKLNLILLRKVLGHSN